MALLDDKTLTQDRTQTWVAEPGLVPELNLDRQALCGVALGETFDKLRALGAATEGSFGPDGDYAWFGRGLRVELSRGRCVSFQIYFSEEEGYAPFTGTCVYRGSDVRLSSLTTEAQLTARFGQPYWRDEDEDGERLLFYELEQTGTSPGRVEWQVELDEEGRLACLLLVTPPLLAREDRRQSYGVTRPWPP